MVSKYFIMIIVGAFITMPSLGFLVSLYSKNKILSRLEMPTNKKGIIIAIILLIIGLSLLIPGAVLYSKEQQEENDKFNAKFNKMKG